MIWESQPEQAGGDAMPVRPANFFEWRTRIAAFEEVAWSRDAMFNLTGEGVPESLLAYRFSANMLDVLGVQPMLGRGFRREEDRPEGAKVVLLSHKLWQRRYAGDPNVLGRSVTLNGESHTIIGVMPASFNHPEGVEIWTPIALPPAVAARRDITLLRLVGRLKPGVTREQAQAELASLYEDLERRHREAAGLTVKLAQLGDAGDAKPLLAVLLGAVGFVLLIACVNVANLLLADATGRQRELAVRAALGASQIRVARQLLTESMLLALAGGLVGALLAWWTRRSLVALFPQTISNLDLPRVDEVVMDWRVAVFAIASSVAAGLFFGLLPALKVARSDLQAPLRTGERSGLATRRTHAALVVAEVALSIVLLAGAMLMVQSFIRVQRQDLGFTPSGVLTARVMLPRYRYADNEQLRRFATSVLERLAGSPGVESVGLTNFLPLSGWWGNRTFWVDGQPEPMPGAEPTADARMASEDYFRTMGIRVIAGRAFTARDDERLPRVVIVNQTLAERYWPGQSAIGRRILIQDNGTRVPLEIVGVIADVRSFGLEEEIHAEMFRPLWQEPWPLLAITVRSAVAPETMAGTIREAVWSVDRDQPITHVLPMEDLAAEALAFRRVGMVLAAGFGLLALALAGLGIYAVSSYSVTRRTREIGVRVALGATRREVVRLVLREGVVMTATGVVIGLAAAAMLTRYLTSLLFEVQPGDPTTLAAVSGTLLALAVLATWLPARRAASIDPNLALRAE
jgi:putative ABC transport system permease protein